MDINNMKNIIIVKNLPSNLVDEAIVVIKDKKKVINKDYLRENEANKNVVQGYINEEDFKKIKNIQKDKRIYVVKEAEVVIKNYIDQLDRFHNTKKQVELIKKRYNRIRYLNVMLFIIAVITTAICIIG